MRKTRDPLERFLERCAPPDENGCIRWLGAHMGAGYGKFSIGRRQGPAHRFAWELLVGPIPDGHEVDHVAKRGCKHYDCVAIAHLEPVTGAENRRRQAEMVTHCPRGHAYDETNTKVYRGGRYCRACDRERHRERYHAALT